MDNATLDLLTRAEELVRAWRPRSSGKGEDRFAHEAVALLDALTIEHGCEPLLAFLWLPDLHQVEDVIDRVVQRLAWRPDAVEPLLRICRAGSVEGAARPDVVAAARADTALWAMTLDDLVPALVRVACGDGDAGLREDALGELAERGPDVVPTLERLEDDDGLGAAAQRCLAYLQEHDMVASGGSLDTIDDLVYAYREARPARDDDAEYALWQLAEALKDNEAVLGAKALAPVQEFIRECVERFMGAEDEDEEDAALDELEVFAGACGDVGARLASEEVAQLPVTEGTERLHEVVEALAASAGAAPRLGAAPAEPDDGAPHVLRAALTLPVAELQALTRTPGFRRLRGEILDLKRRPEFLDWQRPAALPPLADRESHEGFVYLALTALLNDPDDEFQAVAALSLLGDRAALPFLRLLEAKEDDPVTAEWVRRVIGWDTQLAEAEGVDLSTWASTPESDDDLGIDFLHNVVFAPAASSGQASEGGEVGHAAEGADTAPSEPLKRDAEVVTGSEAEPPEQLEAQIQTPGVVPPEPMAPPGLASMDEAFEEFLRRMERERGG